VTEPAHGDDFDETFEMDRDALPTGDLPALPPSTSDVKPRIRPIRFGIRMLLLALVLYFAIGLLPDLINAADELTRLNPFLIGLGLTVWSLSRLRGLGRGPVKPVREGRDQVAQVFGTKPPQT